MVKVFDWVTGELLSETVLTAASARAHGPVDAQAPARGWGAPAAGADAGQAATASEAERVAAFRDREVRLQLREVGASVS